MDAAEVTGLVRRAAQGDQRAWQGIVDEYSGLVWSVARGDDAAARTLGERALGVDSWSEEAHQLLVAALLECGDPADARRQLRRCLQALAELGVPPQPRTVAQARRLEVHLHRGRPPGRWPADTPSGPG